MATNTKNFKVKNGLEAAETIIAPASTTAIPPIRIPHGTAPTSPTDGDVWTTSAGIYVRVNGSTVGPLGTGGAGATVTEAEIDFGSTPQYTETFTIVDATVSGSDKIVVSQSGNTATGRVGNDLEWDAIMVGAVAGSGVITVTAVAVPGPVVGKRKIYYQKF